MEKLIISKFGEKPKNKTTWYGLWFGLGASLVPLFLGVFTSVIRPLIDPASMEGREYGLGVEIGFGAVMISLVLVFFALKILIKSYKLGERSWVVWLGLILSILIFLNWIFMIAGEFLFLH